MTTFQTTKTKTSTAKLTTTKTATTKTTTTKTRQGEKEEKIRGDFIYFLPNITFIRKKGAKIYKSARV